LIRRWWDRFLLAVPPILMIVAMRATQDDDP